MFIEHYNIVLKLIGRGILIADGIVTVISISNLILFIVLLTVILWFFTINKTISRSIIKDGIFLIFAIWFAYVFFKFTYCLSLDILNFYMKESSNLVSSSQFISSSNISGSPSNENFFQKFFNGCKDFIRNAYCTTRNFFSSRDFLGTKKNVSQVLPLNLNQISTPSVVKQQLLDVRTLDLKKQPARRFRLPNFSTTPVVVEEISNLTQDIKNRSILGIYTKKGANSKLATGVDLSTLNNTFTSTNSDLLILQNELKSAKLKMENFIVEKNDELNNYVLNLNFEKLKIQTSFVEQGNVLKAAMDSNRELEKKLLSVQNELNTVSDLNQGLKDEINRLDSAKLKTETLLVEKDEKLRVLDLNDNLEKNSSNVKTLNMIKRKLRFFFCTNYHNLFNETCSGKDKDPVYIKFTLICREFFNYYLSYYYDLDNAIELNDFCYSVDQQVCSRFSHFYRDYSINKRFFDITYVTSQIDIDTLAYVIEKKGYSFTQYVNKAFDNKSIIFSDQNEEVNFIFKTICSNYCTSFFNFGLCMKYHTGTERGDFVFKFLLENPQFDSIIFNIRYLLEFEITNANCAFVKNRTNLIKFQFLSFIDSTDLDLIIDNSNVSSNMSGKKDCK